MITVIIAVVHLQEDTLLPYSSATATTAASTSVATSAAPEVTESETVGLCGVLGLWLRLEDKERLGITESDLVAPVV